MSIKNNYSGAEDLIPGAVYVISMVLLSIMANLLPHSLALLIIVGGVWWLTNWIDKRKRQQQQFINYVFNKLLSENEGGVNWFDFARKTHSNLLQAQQYLDEKAKKCAAQVDVTDEGNIIYYFPIKKSSFPSLPFKIK
jgi:hypothetical protein